MVYCSESGPSYATRNYPASQVPYGTTTPLEIDILVVEICNTEAASKSRVFSSASWIGEGEEFKPMENCYDRSVFWVEWEPDSRGRQTWTTASDWNVKMVLKRLKAREMCSEILVLTYLSQVSERALFHTELFRVFSE